MASTAELLQQSHHTCLFPGPPESATTHQMLLPVTSFRSDSLPPPFGSTVLSRLSTRRACAAEEANVRTPANMGHVGHMSASEEGPTPDHVTQKGCTFSSQVGRNNDNGNCHNNININYD